jgi:4-methylaminobutanoate oxidase (formaldehyde-forming)
MQPFQSGRRYLHDRTTEALGLLYAMHWPFQQYQTARGARRSPFHEALIKAGAVMGELSGWERPNWFAPEGVEPVYRYSYGRQNWFEPTAAECHAVRDSVGLFDQSSFSKFLVTGADACAVLNRICANDVDRQPGTVVYTQWLNERGGIEADLTVTRLAETEFLVVTTAAGQTRDFAWLKRHIPDDARCAAVDVTSGLPMLGLMGPNSRALLEDLTGEDLSNGAFPFATSKEIEIGYARVRASRITYVGELGWELYIPAEFAAHAYDVILDAGRRHGLVHAGYHAMNACRMEKAYRHWGHDIGDEDTPIQAGLGFAVAYDKPGGFIGREALLRQKEQGIPRRRLVQFKLEDDQKLLYHEEPIYRDGALIGSITSGMYGHRVDASLGMGYLRAEEGVTKDFVDAGHYEIEIAAERIPAQAQLAAFYDPKMTRVKGVVV